MRTALALVIALLVIAAAGLGGGYLWLQSKASGNGEGQPVGVTIDMGTAGTAVADTLQQKGVIDSALAFRIYMKTRNISTDLRAGKYNLRTGMPYADVLARLQKGPAIEYVKVSIPEGFTLEQTAAQVEKKTHITAADFFAAATPATVRPSVLPPNINSLEGFLYPTTYFIEKKDDAASLVKRMVAEFEKQLAGQDMTKAAALGRSPYDIIVIASMIEEEAKADEERKNISAVIHNRLKSNIPLGIDATIQYAFKVYDGRELRVSQLESDTPYNTRKFAGLPPGPIASPRAGSINAALQPAAVDYLYYVLGSDCVHHTFTASPAEFSRAKAAQPRNC